MINAEAMNSVTEKKQRRRSILTKDQCGWHPGAGPAGLEHRNHRSPTWLHSRHTQGALLAGSDQPARTQRGQGGAAGAAGASAASRQSRRSRSGPMPLPCRPHCNSAELPCHGCANTRKPSA